MTTGTVLILLAVAFALVVSLGVLIPRGRATSLHTESTEPTESSGEVESELLRRPLRSRQRV